MLTFRCCPFGKDCHHWVPPPKLKFSTCRPAPINRDSKQLGLWVCRRSALLYTCRPSGAMDWTNRFESCDRRGYLACGPMYSDRLGNLSPRVNLLGKVPDLRVWGSILARCTQLATWATGNKSDFRVHTDTLSIRSVHDHTLRILKCVNPETTPLCMIVHHAVGIALAAYDKVRMSCATRVMANWVVAQIH